LRFACLDAAGNRRRPPASFPENLAAAGFGKGTKAQAFFVFKGVRPALPPATSPRLIVAANSVQTETTKQRLRT